GSKLFGVEKNNADAYLPHTAESTKVVDYYMNLPGHPVLSSPAVVVYVRDGGITPADEATVSADVARYQKEVPGLGGPVTGPVPSPDHKALAVSIPLLMPDNVDLGPAVNAIGNVSQATASDGLRAYIGGPAALAYDANKAFNGLDTTLLFSAGVVVIVVLLLTYRSPFLWFFPVLSAVFALQLAQGIMYLLVRHTGVIVSGPTG